MDYKEIDKIFHRDGYRLAHQFLEEGITAVKLTEAIHQLYHAIDELLEAFLRRSSVEGRPAACKKGCSWCCHQAVFAVTHEFLYIQHFLTGHFPESARKQLLENARVKAAGTGEKTVEEQLRFRGPCPFLDQGACSIYPARPMACRIYLSSSVDACLKAHENPADERQFADLFEFPLRAGRMLNEGFVAYLKQSGLKTVELPVEQGYLQMVESGQTMAGWISSAHGSA